MAQPLNENLQLRLDIISASLSNMTDNCTVLETLLPGLDALPEDLRGDVGRIAGEGRGEPY